MFGTTIKNEPQQDKRRDLITSDLLDRVTGKRLHLTPILMEDEPFRTNALEVLDGVRVDSGRPQYNTDIALGAQVPPVRLVALSNTPEGVKFHPSGKITTQRDERQSIPGTSHTRTTRVTTQHGHDVRLSQKEARAVLARDGWPIVDYRSKGARRGTVVEYDWLVAEAEKPDTTQDVRDLAAAVKAAVEAPPPAPTTAIKAPREARA